MSDELSAERGAVRLSFAYRLDELNRKASPMTAEQLIEREVRKLAEQDAALDALIAKAKLVGRVEALGDITRICSEKPAPRSQRRR